MEIQNNPQSETLKQLRAAKTEVANLPAGADPIVESTEADEGNAVTKDATVATGAAEEQTQMEQQDEELIKIGEKEFKTQAEAIKYAQQLEQEKLISEAYNMGIQETIRATRPQEEPKPEEDNFDEKFYTDPKGTLREVKEQATKEAIATIRAEQEKEKMWSSFLNDYPDIDRRDAERILMENMDTLGKMTDIAKAKQILATKTRTYYQGIVERLKPRTELSNKGGQVVSSGVQSTLSVTQKKVEEKPLTMSQQMKNLKRRT